MWRTRVRRGVVPLAICSLLVMAACVAPLPTPTPDDTPTLSPARLRVAGATSMYPVAEALLAAYAEQAPQVQITLEIGVAGDGADAVRRGLVEIGLMARDLPSEAERTQMPEFATLLCAPIALDGVVIIVHADNPVRGVSVEQLRRIYAGDIHDWGDLGGRPGDIVVVSREAASDTRQVMEAKVMQGEAVTLRAVVAPTSAAVVAYVQGHPDAIGYVAAPYLRAGVKGLFVEGVSPDKAAVRAGNYPLIRPLYLVTAQEPTPAARAFLAFVLGPTGQAIVGRFHVPLE